MRPQHIFPHEAIPEGMRVSEHPDVFDREPEQEDIGVMVYIWKHCLLVLPPGCISEDGLIDSESVVRDWKNHTCAKKYRRGYRSPGTLQTKKAGKVRSRNAK